MNAHVVSILEDNLQTMSDKVPVCCFMFDVMSIRRLTIMEALRTLVATAGQTILHIMPWTLRSLVYIKSGSNQLLSI